MDQRDGWNSQGGLRLASQELQEASARPACKSEGQGRRNRTKIRPGGCARTGWNNLVAGNIPRSGARVRMVLGSCSCPEAVRTANRLSRGRCAELDGEAKVSQLHAPPSATNKLFSVKLIRGCLLPFFSQCGLEKLLPTNGHISRFFFGTQ